MLNSLKIFLKFSGSYPWSWKTPSVAVYVTVIWRQLTIKLADTTFWCEQLSGCTLHWKTGIWNYHKIILCNLHKFEEDEVFFIVTALRTSNLTHINLLCLVHGTNIYRQTIDQFHEKQVPLDTHPDHMNHLL